MTGVATIVLLPEFPMDGKSHPFLKASSCSLWTSSSGPEPGSWESSEAGSWIDASTMLF